MENRFWDLVRVIATLLVIILAVISFALYQKAQTAITEMAAKQEEEKKRTVEILTKWVFSVSEKISRTECREIVMGVMMAEDPLLMLAIIELESKKFMPGALSSEGAIGWCQVMYEDRSGKDIHGKALIKAGIIKEKRDLWDIDKNIKAGAFIFEGYLKQTNGDVTKALDRYLGKKDGAYTLRILTTYANLSILVAKEKKV